MQYSCIKYIWWHWTSFYLSFWMIWFLQGIFPFLLSSCKQTPLTNKTPECIRCSVTLNQFRSAILNRISSSRAYRYFLSFGQFSMHLLHSEVWYPWKEHIQWLLYQSSRSKFDDLLCSKMCPKVLFYTCRKKKSFRTGSRQFQSKLERYIYILYIFKVDCSVQLIFMYIFCTFFEYL